MRFVVFIFGAIASLLTAAIGVGFLLWDAGLAWLMENVPANVLAAFSINENSTVSMTGITYANSGLIVLLAAAYGLLGSLFALFRCGKQGGSLMLIPVLGAAFINPISLVATSFLALVGCLSFFVRPLPLNPPAQKKDDAKDADDED